MYNLHPPLTSFPFALFSVVVILEVVNLRRPNQTVQGAARINLVLAGVFTLFAFLSGYMGNEFANRGGPVSQDAIEFHHLMGKALLFLIVPTVALKFVHVAAEHNKAAFGWLYAACLAVTYLLVLYTGFLGAELVFEHGAGVARR